MEKVYVAGPMRGYPNFNYAAFEAAKEKLENTGLWVVSPREIDRIFHVEVENGELSQAELRKLAIRIMVAMVDCDSIYLLRGWVKSKGARMELAIAEFLGLDVHFEENDDQCAFVVYVHSEEKEVLIF